MTTTFMNALFIALGIMAGIILALAVVTLIRLVIKAIVYIIDEIQTIITRRRIEKKRREREMARYWQTGHEIDGR